MNETPDLHKNPEAAAEMAAAAVLHYLNGLDIEGAQKKRNWVDKVFDEVLSRIATVN